MKKIPSFKTREEIPDQFKWNLQPIYQSPEEWNSHYEELKERLDKVASYETQMVQSAEGLKNTLEFILETEMQIEKLYVYAHLKKDENTTIPEYQELYQKAYSLYVQFSQKTSFFTPTIMEMGEETILRFMDEIEELQLYRHFFENILRKKEHTLSKEMEEMLAMAGEVLSTPGKVFSMLDNADLEFGSIQDEEGKEIQLTKGLYGKFQQHPDRRLRKDSYMTLYQPYIQHRNTLAANYAGQLQSHVYTARVKKYKSSLEMALFSNNIPEEVYHQLIENVHQNLSPNQRYVSLRKRILNLDEVHDYDLLAPLAPAQHQEYSYDEAVELILEAFQPLGQTYVNDLKKGLESGWIDVYETKGKRSGAYSSGAYLTQPYVLLNYSGTLNDVFTLAHELGHSMHSFYTRKNNPFVYGDYSIFLAEIASTLNEGLLTHYLMKHAKDKDEKISLVNEYLDKFARTFYRQVIFAEFELKTHQMAEQGEPITADKLDELFGSIYQQYHGQDLTMDRETKAMWSRIPHFYYQYYVFQYATGIAASTAILHSLMNDGEPAVNKYLNFLSAGSTDYPLEVLKKAGVDMTTPDPVIRVTRIMNTLLDELEQLTNS
ncbi:MAG: oligoendopeptidase F [Calditrichia bacterium]